MGRIRSALVRVLTARGLLVLFGLAGVVTAYSLVILPAIIPPTVRNGIEQAVAAVGANATTTAVALFIGVYALYRTWNTRAEHADAAIRSGDELDDSSTAHPSTSAGSQTPVVGADVDAKLTEAGAALVGDGDSESVEAVTHRLEAVLVRALMERDGVPEQAAQAQVKTGDWTDDAIAAAFLGDERAPSLPVWRRLYAWLYPERTFTARYHRTLEEVKQVSANAYTDYDPGRVLPTATDVSDGFDSDASGREEVARW